MPRSVRNREPRPPRPETAREPARPVVPVDEAPESPAVTERRNRDGAATLGEQVETRGDEPEAGNRVGE